MHELHKHYSRPLHQNCLVTTTMDDRLYNYMDEPADPLDIVRISNDYNNYRSIDPEFHVVRGKVDSNWRKPWPGLSFEQFLIAVSIVTFLVVLNDGTR